MKMRLVKDFVPAHGLTVGKIYEGTAVEQIWFNFHDDDGCARSRLLDEFEPVAPEPGNRYNASVEGKPQPGQWWFQRDKQDRSDAKFFRVFFCGKDSNNRLIFEDADGNTEIDHGVDWSGWHHEPACTGWDWMPEVKTASEYPKWYVPRNPNEVCESFGKPIAYYRRDSQKKGETFYTDGESFKWGYWEEDLNGELIPCSQSDAEARVKKKPVSPDVVESPDDWVTQDRVIARKDVDEYRWIWRSGNPSKWHTYDWNDVKNHVHGYTDNVGDRLELRCRRRDLPVVEEAKTPLPCSYCSKPEFKGWHNGKCPYCGKVKEVSATVTVYEVVYGDTLEKMDHDTMVGDECLNRFKRRFKYVSVVSTKTVEVML